MINYRKDIDGLRAIAVVAVMLYHANSEWLPGGFLGVDVFFVISGYLITSLIRNDIAQGRFSLTNFYERRARRILPALFLVLLATVPFAVIYLGPTQLVSYGKALLATVVFSSNFVFWADTGYFMANAELHPILHTWSLAVEEQFYLLFPLLLMALSKRSARFCMAVIAAFLAASFAISLILVEQDPAANFYLLPSRGWELMSGALCALIGTRSSKVAPFFVVVGVILILGSFALLDRTIAMPSWPTLPVVLGTVLIVLYGAASEARLKILSNTVLVRIGLISYGAYLWHVPVLVFARFHFPGDIPTPVLVGLLLQTLVLATLSYRFEERPFRQRGPDAFASNMGLVSSTIAAAIMLVGASSATLSGLFKPTSLAQSIEARLVTNFGLHEDCEGSFTLSPNCRTADVPRTVLWGDSFAMHLAPALEKGTSWGGLIQHTKSVCAPVPGLAVVTAEYPESWSRGCLTFNAEVLDWLSKQESVELVVVSSPFGLIHHTLLQRDGTLAKENQASLVRQSLIDLNQQVIAMGKQLVIVSPPPVTGDDLGHCLAMVARSGADPTACDFEREDAHSASHTIYRFLESVASDVPTLFLDSLICPDGVCDLMVGDVFIFRDEGHLSVEGARHLGQAAGFWTQLQRVLGEKT